ncbi:MAG: hypothetical protein HEQ35_31465 [Gloeotrichia echinulata IR180]
MRSHLNIYIYYGIVSSFAEWGLGTLRQAQCIAGDWGLGINHK